MKFRRLPEIANVISPTDRRQERLWDGGMGGGGGQRLVKLRAPVVASNQIEIGHSNL